MKKRGIQVKTQAAPAAAAFVSAATGETWTERNTALANGAAGAVAVSAACVSVHSSNNINYNYNNN